MIRESQEKMPSDLADRFIPGFRLSPVDVLVLLVGGLGAGLVARELWWAGAMIAFVVGHFFLFCNVFRIARSLELIWAGAFVALAGATLLYDSPGWSATFGLSMLLSLVLLAIAMRQPSYHGVLWQRVNPQLPAWWAKQTSRPPSTPPLS